MNALQQNPRRWLTAWLVTAVMVASCAAPRVATEPAADPLSSWNDGPARQSIVEFVAAVTDPAGPDFVPAPERVAVFDNDGTLLAEKPDYFQILFALDRIRAMAGDHPGWRDEMPFRAVLDNDRDALEALDAEAVTQLILATHGGMTTAEFEAAVRDWLAVARHPGTHRPYVAMVYQPMLELLDYLRANDFRVFIVSAGSIGFMRPWTEDVYGIPPENIVGTSMEMTFRERDGAFVIDREPQMHHFNDRAGKPVGIERFIGRRPILAVGNSDGDYQMLQWTTNGEGPGLGVLVHHTDAEREWAYDRDSHQGRLDRALTEAPQYGWTVIDMARDWNTVFPGE